MNDEDFGKEFIIKNLTGRWIFYGIESNGGNDYGLPCKDYPFRYYFHNAEHKGQSHKVDRLSDIIRPENNKNKINKIMKITNIVKQLLDSDTRKLVKAGLINGDLALTEEGVSELLGIIFLANKAELVKVAEEKLDDKNNQ